MLELLRNKIRELISISDKDLEVVLDKFKPLSAKKNEILITGGQQGNQKMFFVVDGCLRIFYINEDGVDSTRLLVFEQEFATSLISFITGESSFEFIQALEPTNLYYISKSDFYELLEIVPIWEKFYRQYLEFAYVTNTNRLRSFITMDAKERYKQLLKQNRAIVQRLPNKIVASYINVSQETLSRLKSKI